jgi:16S rRNA (guanine527-N7)-methyltransferase
MKGPNVDAEIKAAEKLSDHFRLIQNDTYMLPKTTHERRMVVYQKIKNFEIAE